MRYISLSSFLALTSTLHLTPEKEEQLLKAFIYFTVAIHAHRNVEPEDVAAFSGLKVDEALAWSHFYRPLDLEEDTDCLFECFYDHEAAGTQLRSILVELIMARIVRPIEARIFLAYYYPATSQCSGLLEDIADSFGCSETFARDCILHVVHTLKGYSTGQYA